MGSVGGEPTKKEKIPQIKKKKVINAEAAQEILCV